MESEATAAAVVTRGFALLLSPENKARLLVCYFDSFCSDQQHSLTKVVRQRVTTESALLLMQL